MACCDSRALRRSALPDKSKKVSKFSDAALQVGKAIDELRHPNYSVRRDGET
jgi:hypothetical protein